MNIRTIRPEKGNKYYIRKANGGYSPCIKGTPTYDDIDTLANCVGYAVGRFNEIGGYEEDKYLGNTNAENFTNFCSKQGLELGQTPKQGACMVWEGKGSLAGHVAIVEKVINNTQVMTSESGWNCKAIFWTQTRKKGTGNWGAGSKYTFKGFIYNPAVPDEWTIGTYKLLVAKTIRTDTTLSINNRVKVKQCMASVKANLTSTKPNDIAVLKVGTEVNITEIVIHDNRVWGKMRNSYIVLCNADGTAQAEKI